jgi:hypothetical protein
MMYFTGGSFSGDTPILSAMSARISARACNTGSRRERRGKFPLAIPYRNMCGPSPLVSEALGGSMGPYIEYLVWSPCGLTDSMLGFACRGSARVLCGANGETREIFTKIQLPIDLSSPTRPLRRP